ncbi:Fucose permease [Clostridium amylolyticum]|uniref:Fucose permease n=1 Tax=Clostridium amylolyticum TaxID=1121298 RepID=A0A1M6FAC7_9CLOT|nr:MFS transporter [Clostridium amylolyticum]SHI94623.1 Fucose permease [Clostridium amylolyticum]
MKYTILLIVIYLAFISLGLPDGVFGVAWPDMRVDFSMPLATAGMISIFVMSFSAISSFSSGRILKRFGTGRVTFISCLMTGLALLGYSKAPSFAWLMVMTLPLGLGQGAVDSGLNNYVAKNYSSRHMSWLHCCWGIGASLGPFIMTKTLAANKEWRSGYVTIATMQLILAAIFLMSLKLWKSEEAPKLVESHKTLERGKTSILKSISPWLGILMFFFYAGTEYSVGLWANSMLVESRNIPKEISGLWISYYYGALMLGRFVTGIIVNKLGNRKVIRLGIMIAVLGAILLYIPLGSAVTMSALMLIGFGFAPIYPCMMHETPRRFDEDTTKTLIGYQVGAACIGGSALSASLGLIFSKTSLEALAPSLLVLLLTMVFISEWLNKRTV